MATSFPSAPNDGLRSRWGHDQSWSCLKHFKPIEFYCPSHKIALCHSCAHKEHQKQCSLHDIEDKITELTKELQERNVNIEQAKENLRNFDAKLKECEAHAVEHMTAVKASLHTSFEGEMKAISDKQRMKESAINEKADDDIRIINQRREEQLKQSAEEAEQQRASIRDLRGELLGDVDRIAAKLSQYTNQLKEKSTATSHYIEDSEEHIHRLQKSDRELVNFAALVFEVLDETLQGIDIEKDVACVERAVRAVRKVTCSVSNVNGTVRGRIDTGEWERVDTISPDLRGEVLGLVSDNEIGVHVGRRVDGKYVSSIVDVNTHQETARIIDEEAFYITSCAAVSSELIVCGKSRGGCKGDHLTGLVSLYDRRGQPVRDITIPRHTKDSSASVYVDVDGDGMVVAAESQQPHIYVLNPSDGAIVRSVTLPGGRKVGLGISSLKDSSGDVVVLAGCDGYSIVSRSGAVKTTIRDDAWRFARCSVDMVTGALYVAYSDQTRGVYRVDRCTSEGVIAERGVVEYPGKDIEWLCGVAITPTGKLVVNGGKGRIFIYKQSINLTHPSHDDVTES